MKLRTKSNNFRVVIKLCLVVITILLFSGEYSTYANSKPIATQTSLKSIQASEKIADLISMYFPISMKNAPWINPFGMENNEAWNPGTDVHSYGDNLNGNWVRVGTGLSWRKLQPNENDPIQWDILADFDEDLKEIKSLGMTPIVVIKDNPHWAVISNARTDGQLTSCAAIQPSKIPAFEQFVRALVRRYQGDIFDVHHWEIGNEPDVDPDLVRPNQVFGCWGNIDDPYYGGREYGEMIKIIGKAIKEEDPRAKVWLGGLLLDSPNTTDPQLGKPERFLRGVLKEGAAPYIDVIPYHWYPPYLIGAVDNDNIGQWKDWGGGAIGKARYIRQILSEYGVDKNLALNETALMCPPTIGGQPVYYCNPPPVDFYLTQANFVIRSFVRGLSGNVKVFIWYTLNGPGWRYTGLLDEDNQPKPVYFAYQHLIHQLRYANYSGEPNYGSGIEAYAFQRESDVLHILWGVDKVIKTISVPNTKFIAAYDRLGNEIAPLLVGSNFELKVGISPIYIVRKP